MESKTDFTHWNTERKRQKSETIDRENDPWDHNHGTMLVFFFSAKKVVPPV